MNFFIMKISTIFVIFVFHCLTKTEGTETVKNEVKSLPIPQWPELTKKEETQIKKSPFLTIVFNLTNIFNKKVNPITTNSTTLIEEIENIEKKLRDRIMQGQAVRILNLEELEESEESTVVVEDDYVPLKDTDSLITGQSFGPALMDIESFLFSLGSEKPRIEFLTINLKTLEATFKANGIGTGLGKKEGESTSDEELAQLYVKKSENMYSLMKYLIKLEQFGEYAFHKIRVLSLMHSRLPLYLNNVKPDLVVKFNWPKRYEFIEKSIKEMKKFNVSSLFPEAYQTYILMATFGFYPDANETLRSSARIPIGRIVGNFGRKTLASTKFLTEKYYKYVPQVREFNPLFTEGSSRIQAIAQQLMKGKVTMAQIKKFAKEQYDNFEDAVPNLIGYFNREPEPASTDYQAYCMEKNKPFKEMMVTKMPKFEDLMERAVC